MIDKMKSFRRVKDTWPHGVCILPECHYLAEVIGGIDVGAWFFHPHEDGLMVHADMGPQCRGKAAADSARNAFNWIFENTDAQTIYAHIPSDKKNVHMLAVVVGMDFVFCENGNRCYRIERSMNNERMVV